MFSDKELKERECKYCRSMTCFESCPAAKEAEYIYTGLQRWCEANFFKLIDGLDTKPILIRGDRIEPLLRALKEKRLP